MILEAILSDTRAAVVRRKAETPEEALRAQARDLPPALDFAGALRQPGVSVIAEVKRASPSRGALNLGLEPGQMAVAYAEAGAAAISVLTEERRFHGSLEDLRAAREALDAQGVRRPLLRKDFVLDSYQLLEARVWGADAALLIAAALDDGLLAELLAQALALGLCPLVEVHSEEELARVLPLNPPVIGINNRDLRDFTVSLDVTRRLRPLVPPDAVVVSESGIRGPEEMQELAALGVDAALIGEALVTAVNPSAALAALREAGR
ncbi:MAG: indole-3-glycerol phosphate synthase TrpC [Chloroflexi bacterium]|nr:indole-3-glycerol phosphate synthase TrpC [Chloroflexota bacterium]